MARAEVLEGILHKLVRVNAMIGAATAANMAADVQVSDTVLDALAVTVGAGTNVSISVDIADIQTVLNAVGA